LESLSPQLTWKVLHSVNNIHLTASFPGQPG